MKGLKEHFGRPLSLRGKFLLVIVIFIVLAVLLHTFRLQTEFTIFLFLVLPILIVLLGKVAELIFRFFERISTGPLSLIAPKDTLLLFSYYVLLSLFLALLIENSAMLSILSFKPDEWQVAFVSLGLAFLPRVLSYASGVERARSTLLAIFTPLTLTAAITLFTQPGTTAFRLLTLELCFIGSLFQVVFGDLALYLAGSLGIIHPTVTIETISMLDLRRLVHSQLETIQWDRICKILGEAKHFGRVDIIQKILESMSFFIYESRERGARLARIVFIDALIKAVYSEPGLNEELVSCFKDLIGDQEAWVRARMAYGLGIMARAMPEKSLRWLSELSKDKDFEVLGEVGTALALALRINSEAVSHIIKLSLNPVFLDVLKKRVSLKQPSIRMTRSEALAYDQEAERVYAMRHGLRPFRDSILQALKVAYVNSPETVIKHIQSCSSSEDVRKKVLAAAIVSDQNFTQNDQQLLQIKEKLKKSRLRPVKDALEFSRVQAIVRSLYRSGEIPEPELGTEELPS